MTTLLALLKRAKREIKAGLHELSAEANPSIDIGYEKALPRFWRALTAVEQGLVEQGRVRSPSVKPRLMSSARTNACSRRAAPVSTTTKATVPTTTASTATSRTRESRP